MNPSITESKPTNQPIGLNTSTREISSHLLQIIIETNPEVVSPIYHKSVNFYANNVRPNGLRNEALPSYFVEKEHAGEIQNNVQTFLLKHLILDHLMNQITLKKIPFANHPRLTKMEFTPEGHINYHFEVSTPTLIDLKDWKLFTFRAPKRKRYKDLDKQVDLFLQRETEGTRKQDRETVQVNDWINFEATLVDDQDQPILPLHRTSLWLKITPELLEKPFHALFLGKKLDESFVVESLPFSEDLPDNVTETGKFSLTIRSITKGTFMCVESIRNIFKLKNKTDLHAKLIEIFSYRNDISQRRSIVEEIFHLLFSKHRFEIPKHFTARKKDALLTFLKKQSDYRVYQGQKDFIERVNELAEKLLKEEILIDQISYRENIRAARKDIRSYLTLFNNSRLKEFIYFKASFEALEESDTPVQEAFLRQAVQREKTLNHIIYTLMN